MEISRHLRSVEELFGLNAFYWRTEPGTVQRHLPPSWKHPLGTQCHSFIQLLTVTLATRDEMIVCYKNLHKSKWDNVNIQTSKHKIQQAHRQGRIHLAWESRKASQKRQQHLQALMGSQKFVWYKRATRRRGPGREMRLLFPFRTVGALEPRTDLEQS